MEVKSLYKSLAGSHFYGTEYEIWADFGPVGSKEKKIGAVKYASFVGVSFMFSCAQNVYLFIF